MVMACIYDYSLFSQDERVKKIGIKVAGSSNILMQFGRGSCSTAWENIAAATQRRGSFSCEHATYIWMDGYL